MLQTLLAHYQSRVEQAITSRLDARQGISPILQRAMQYSVLNGGKRLRPTLVYLSCELMGGRVEQADAAACAIEAIHSYSLVHDDLPAMDNDELRRGKPTCHIQFDEATAILAGDALLTWAFELLSTPDKHQTSDQKLRMIQILARASGDLGMIDGQSFDLSSVGETIDLDQLKAMHAAKTGALIKSSLTLGALSSGSTEDTELHHLSAYADALGLAFQIQDDILDIEGTTEVLGKPQGSDIERHKPTYPSLIGLSASRAWLQTLHEEAVKALEPFGERAAPLIALANFVITRDH